MSRVVCIAGPRPAVGKTTTAVNLSLALALAGQQTLLIDWCPNQDATRQFGKTRAAASVSRVHSDAGESPGDPSKRTMPESRAMAMVDGLHLSTRGWDQRLVTGIAGWQSQDCQVQGKRWSEKVNGAGHDVVMIDCPADVGPFTESALWAADEILLSLRCESSALQGVADLIQIVRRVHAGPGKSLEFAGVLLTQFHPENGLSEHIEREVREFFGDIVFETVIPWDETVLEAVWRGQPLLELAPSSRAACAYIELCMEVLRR